MAELSIIGMPHLSGPAPPSHDSDISCRKCNEDLNTVFTRARKCNHCGYSYCLPCSDYQALMPRRGASTGFEPVPVPVCVFCLENLTSACPSLSWEPFDRERRLVTAGDRTYLRNLAPTRLKKYVDAYNIKIDGILEKDELIENIIAAREKNGCLPYANESFYRRHSVPNGRTGRPRGPFPGREGQPAPPRRPPSNVAANPPRPDLDPSGQQRSPPAPRRTTPRPRNPPQSQSSSRVRPYPPPRSTPPPTAAPTRPHHTPPSGPPPPQPRPDAARASDQGTVPGTGNASHPSASPPSSPIPTLDELLAMADEEVSHMSISALKSILHRNGVDVHLMLEKRDLVAGVHALLDDEYRERAEAAIHAREEEQRRHAMMEEQRLLEEQVRRERAQAHLAGHDGQWPMPEISPPPMMGTSDLERIGLCVICKNEEVIPDVVDCGHLAMCRRCSDRIMSSSRTCPMCRAYIVTFLRAFTS